VPILRLSEHSLLPADLARLHCVDFRNLRRYMEAFDELLRVLMQPLPDLGPPLTGIPPSLPPHFLVPNDAVVQLNDVVLAVVRRPEVISPARSTTVLHGMSGIGKSVVASAFARAMGTRRAFVDGIAWLQAANRPLLPDDLCPLLRGVNVT
jgi:hypothetical protein